MTSQLAHLKEREKKILAENSNKRKELEKKLREDIEREYWSDYNSSNDRQPYFDMDWDNNESEEE